MKHIWTKILVIILIIANIYLFFEYNRLMKRSKIAISTMNNNLNFYKVNKETLEKQFCYYLKNSNQVKLDSSLTFVDTLFNSYNVQNCFNKKKLVLILPKNTCDICNDKAIDKILELNDKIGIENLCIIVPYNRYREFYAFFKKYESPIQIFALKSGELPFEAENGLVPYCFITDKNLLIDEFFLLDYKNQSVFSLFIKRIEASFK